jgi:hypothetical protein
MTAQTHPSEEEILSFDGRTAKSAKSLSGMLGWNSVAVLKAGKHRDGDRLKTNKATIFIVLVDPWPEYKTIVFIDGAFAHTQGLTSSSHQQVFEKHLDDYGEAEIIPLSDVDFIEREKNGIPYYTPTTESGDETDDR